MENLWAPWRMEYLTGKREEGCIFCKKPAERDRLKENFILHVGQLAFAILNRYPYHTGHIMVIPLRHTSDFSEISPDENAEMCLILQAGMKALSRAYRPEGFNLGMNLGQCAGAGIREHLHHHLVPRWVGDTNFFPLISQTRATPELLTDTYERLRPLFRSFEEDGLLRAGGHTSTEGQAPGLEGMP